ncbi:MAG TPA: YoaK family protein [Gemmatimonadaceae bacterium]|jgi:uncharacterized membrane protein YoaK (UPF0700 family)
MLFAYLLILSAGYVDGYGLFAYGTFLSFMSGNTTLMGYNLGRCRLSAALPPASAVIGFVVGAAIGSTVSRNAGPRARRIVLAIVAALQAIVLLLTVGGVHPSPLEIVVLSAGMGMLNRAVTRIGGQSVSLTFVTGTLSQLANHVSNAIGRLPLDGAVDARDSHVRRTTQLAGVWIAFLGGAALGGWVAPRLAEWALAPSVALLVVLAFSANLTSQAS